MKISVSLSSRLPFINLFLTDSPWHFLFFLFQEADWTGIWSVCKCYVRLNGCGSAWACAHRSLRLTSLPWSDLPPRTSPAARRWRALFRPPGNHFPCRRIWPRWSSRCCTGTSPTPSETRSLCSGWLDHHTFNVTVEKHSYSREIPCNNCMH